jgi:enterochelin esterase-like enzyme
MLRIHRFLQAQPVDAAAVDAFLAEHEFPLVEDNQATFVFRGEAEAVYLRHWIFGLTSSQPFARVPETDLWYTVLELPPRSRVEYKLDIHRGGHSEWILDPLNPQRAHDPFGANSVCCGKGYRTPAWTQHDAESRPGTIEEHTLTSRAFGDERRVLLYKPARFRKTRRYPLLVVHDGEDYLRYAQLKEVLDNLIHRLEVAPMVVALTIPHDRLVEYPDDARHVRFLTEELVPMLEGELPLVGGPTGRGVMGASFGAVASLSAAWRKPGYFGRLLLQSGSFAFTDIGTHNRSEAFDPVVRFVNAFREAPGRPSDRVFMSCGMYESLIYENRSLQPLFASTGMSVRYVEARDGHNWENWRDRLREGLSWLFPGPLLLVYE